MVQQMAHFLKLEKWDPFSFHPCIKKRLLEANIRANVSCMTKSGFKSCRFSPRRQSAGRIHLDRWMLISCLSLK